MGIFAYYSRYGLAMVIGRLATALSIVGGLYTNTAAYGVTGDDVSLLPPEKDRACAKAEAFEK